MSHDHLLQSMANVRPALLYAKAYAFNSVAIMIKLFTLYWLRSLNLLREVSRMDAQNILRCRQIKNAPMNSVFTFLSDAVVT